MNKENTIPAAEEFFDQWCDSKGYTSIDECNDIEECMIEFAKLHVQATLKAASEVYLSGEIDEKAFDKMGEEILSEKALEFNKKQILNAYPLNNIK